MPSARHLTATVLKNSAPIFLARVVGNDGAVLVQGDLASAAYSIYRLDPNDPDSRTSVSSHSAVALVVASTIFNSPQKDALWQNDDGEYVDDTGYNLKFQPSVATAVPFAVAGATYLVEATLTPSSGQPIKVCWQVNAI